MKKAFLIRGFRLGTTAADPDFQEIRDAVRQCGYEPVPVSWPWNRKTMSQYVDAFVDFYEQQKSDHNIVIGHSFGAMAALAAASRIQPDALLLCSISGFFKEDLPKYTSYDPIIARMGKRRRADFEQLSGDQLAQAVRDNQVRTVLLYGALEKDLHPKLYDRVMRTAQIMKPHQLIEIPGADHAIRSEPYLKALQDVLAEL